MSEAMASLSLPRVSEVALTHPPTALQARASAQLSYGSSLLLRAWRKRRAFAMADLALQQLPSLSDTSLSPAALLSLRNRLRIHRPAKADLAQALACACKAAEQALGLTPYRVQLAAAAALVSGDVIEMDTGEGKTLTAFLAAAVYALMGRSVHLITANDYLAERDGEALAPAFATLGLSTGTVTGTTSTDDRRRAYAADVTFISSKEAAFDYLRDRLLPGFDQRDPSLSLKLRKTLAPSHGAAAPLQRALDVAIIDEIDSVLIDEAGTPLIISADDPDQITADEAQAALDIAETLERGRDFHMDRRALLPNLTPEGRAKILGAARGLSGAFSTRLRREELVASALGALHALERDKDYLISEGKVVIIDPHTGRTMDDRQWGHDLHLLVEAKEGLALSASRKTLASISFQRFFRGYRRLCGMSGTVREVAGELSDIYGAAVTAIPRRTALARTRRPVGFFASEDALWRCVSEEARRLHERGQPILVAVRSVADAERASAILRDAGLSHNVLSASQSADEAAIVARAGQEGQITVVTNMAGRGTDIKLGDKVAERGGLALLMCEMHDSRRIDRQLIGRCARQGDPGLVLELISRNDAALHPLSDALTRLMAGSRLGGLLALALVRLNRSRRERQARQQRMGLVRRDETAARLLAFVGGLE